MQLPTANKEIIDSLIQRAKDKLSSFEEKIELIDRHINTLRQEKHAADTTIEYFSLGKKRKELLLDLFVYPDEYGQTAQLPEWHIDQLQRHSQSMSSSIVHYERCKQRRIEGVEFIKADIKRLEVIGNATYQHPYFFLMLRNF